MYTYTTFAAYFEDQFFSPDDPHKSIYIYAIFWATFIMRPFGSWFFGRWADRHGRRSALTMAVTIMAVGSLVISVLPTRGTIGVGAPILLLICRIVQGFATGGEYGTSATYMSEASTKGHRGFFSSFQYFTLVGGLVTAQAVLLLLSSLMSEATIHAWGWRIPFFIGGVAALIVFFMQKTMDESLSTEHLKSVRSGEDSSSGSLKELFGNHLGNFLLAFTIASGGTLCFYVYTVNAPNIVHSTFSSTPMAATAVNLIALFILMLGQPLGGLIGDRIGRKPVLLFFAAGGVVVYLGSRDLSVACPQARNCIPHAAHGLYLPYRIYLDLRSCEVRPFPNRCQGAGCWDGPWFREFPVRRHGSTHLRVGETG